MTIRMRPAELALIVVCAVASTFAPTFASAGKSTLHEVDRFSKETSTRRFELTVPRDGSEAKLRVEATLREGAMRWTVLDPSGAACWSGEIGPGSEIKLSRSFDAKPGEWTLEIDLRAAAGSYDVAWDAR